MTIVPLTSGDTHDLRRRVLRKDTPSRDVTYPQDDLPGTVHLGVARDGVLVGVSSWAIEAWPDEPDVPALRLRGMAVEDGLQGAGFGRALVDAGVDLAHARGARIVWASARDAVMAFYERCGFTPSGDGFVDAATALPHHHVVRRIS